MEIIARVVGKTLKVTTPKLLGAVAAPFGRTLSTTNRFLHRVVPYHPRARVRFAQKQHVPHPIMLPAPLIDPIVKNYL